LLNTPKLREKGTRQVQRIRPCRPGVALGEPDPTLTPRAGLHLVAELNRILLVVATIDRDVGEQAAVRRGLSVGELVLSLSETMLSGGDFMVDLDFARQDAAGTPLRAVPAVPASTTFIGRAKSFDDEVFAGIEMAVGELTRRWFAMLPDDRREGLAARRPAIDLDPTDVETYGLKKEGVAFNYRGQRTGRPHPAVWAEAGLVLAADLGSGRSDPRPQAPSLIARAIDALPEGLRRPIVRADSGLFDKKVAEAALAQGADFAIAAKRNRAVWRAARQIPEQDWKPAKDMDAEVAPCPYVPRGWPEGTGCVARRVKVVREDLRSDKRTRRRRTIDPNQLRLLEDGEADVAYAYSFILTNLEGDPVEIEKWFRMRALVEERICDSKAGMALRHLPSGYEAVNRTWMWSAFLALNCSVWLQGLAGIDTGPDGRAHGKRLRRELIAVPARVLSHARCLIVRVAPEHHRGVFAEAWRTLVALPSAAAP
jgi:Transposase DDE domain group 1